MNYGGDDTEVSILIKDLIYKLNNIEKGTIEMYEEYKKIKMALQEMYKQNLKLKELKEKYEEKNNGK